MARSPSTNMNFWAKAPLNLVAERVKNSVPPVLRTRRFCKAKGRAVSGAGSWWGETRRGVPMLAEPPRADFQSSIRPPLPFHNPAEQWERLFMVCSQTSAMER